MTHHPIPCSLAMPNGTRAQVTTMLDNVPETNNLETQVSEFKWKSHVLRTEVKWVRKEWEEHIEN